MQFTVQLAFVTDIITNSSSVVYSQAVGVNGFYELLDEIIQAFGVDKSARDIFEISIAHDMDRVSDWVADSYCDENAEFAALVDGCKDWKERNKLCEQKGLALIESGELKIDSSWQEGRFDSSYLVKVKGENTAIGTKVANLFHSWGEYNG